MLACRPPTWVNRHLPRASLRQTLDGHSAPRAGPSCWLRGRASLHLTKPLNTEMTKLTQRRSHASPGRHPGMGWVATRLDEGRHRRNAHTVTLKKRLLPIVWRRVDEAQVPPRPKQLNYIFDRRLTFVPSLKAPRKRGGHGSSTAHNGSRLHMAAPKLPHFRHSPSTGCRK